MTAPDFNDLTPPQSELNDWEGYHFALALTLATRWGARYGYEQAPKTQQLPDEGITDRWPTEADGDVDGRVQILREGSWVLRDWWNVDGHPWLHTPCWRPRPPTWQEQILADVDNLETYNFGPVVQKRLDNIRRALEQAGEGVE